jgi:hypothetical protein
MRKKPAPKRNDGSASPLEARKRALAEQQAKLQADMEAQKRLIEEAPKRVAEEKKRRQEELIKRASRTDRFGTGGALPDPRHSFHLQQEGKPLPARKLRKHRRQGMWTFFVLCAILLGVLFWVYSTVLKP